MNCAEVKKLLIESANISEKDLVCCDYCHEDADEGFNEALAAGSEPCCDLILLLASYGL